MPTTINNPNGLALEHSELKGFSRTVAEIEWLLLVLVLLYLVVGAPPEENRPAILTALFFFGAFVVSFHYFHFYRKETRWRLAFETWVMIGFITWVLWFTGKLESPLLNLYLLTIITSALTLGRLVTLLEMALIAACYIFLGYSSVTSIFTLTYVSQLMAQLAPMLLAAYLTTMLSADIRDAVSRIKVLSETDELTGLLNMRAFNRIAAREGDRAKRYSHSLSVLMVDLDNLKPVNDTHGHEAGNRLLKHVVQHIKDALRSTDVMARYGGDEFVIALPETSGEGAKEVAERMRAAVEGSDFDVREIKVPTTVSIGIASYPEHGADVQEIMGKADKALYRSKQQGRNRCTLFAGD